MDSNECYDQLQNTKICNYEDFIFLFTSMNSLLKVREINHFQSFIAKNYEKKCMQQKYHQ